MGAAAGYQAIERVLPAFLLGGGSARAQVRRRPRRRNAIMRLARSDLKADLGVRGLYRIPRPHLRQTTSPPADSSDQSSKLARLNLFEICRYQSVSGRAALAAWRSPMLPSALRVGRVGQTKPVTIHIPLATHPDFPDQSFDEQLDGFIESKRQLSRHMLAPPTGEQDIASLYKGTVKE